MKPFKIPYSLTIMTPFHIGTGEELDPFSIVINDNYLYRLNQLEFIHYLLQEKEKEFQKVMYVGNIVAIQQFFQENFNPEVKDTWFYHYLINKNIADEYIKKTSSGDNQGLIKEFIRNTALYQPYIPGSSIKGSIRTAILSSLQDSKKVKLNQEKSNDSEVQAILLDYWNSEKKVADIPSDPFKFIKFADIPFKNDWISLLKVEIKNLTADEKPKNPQIPSHNKSSKEPAIPIFMELGLSAKEPRILHSELTINITDNNNPGIKKLLPKGKASMTDFIQMIKDYYKTQFDKEKNVMANFQPLKNAYDILADYFKVIEQKENECIIRLGFGSGQNYCTYAMLNYSPKSRKVVQNLPLGWFKMTFDLKQ